MTTSTINVPSGFVDNVLSQATALFGSFSGIFGLIISVLLVALVAEILIGAIRHK